LVALIKPVVRFWKVTEEVAVRVPAVKFPTVEEAAANSVVVPVRE